MVVRAVCRFDVAAFWRRPAICGTVCKECGRQEGGDEKASQNELGERTGVE